MQVLLAKIGTAINKATYPMIGRFAPEDKWKRHISPCLVLGKLILPGKFPRIFDTM
jgi:hypothetical protein